MLSKMYHKGDDSKKKKDKKIPYKSESNKGMEPSKEAKMRMMAMISKKK